LAIFEAPFTNPYPALLAALAVPFTTSEAPLTTPDAAFEVMFAAP